MDFSFIVQKQQYMENTNVFRKLRLHKDIKDSLFRKRNVVKTVNNTYKNNK